MSQIQKRVFAVLLLISITYFSIFILPNNTGAKDPMMISLFEPDEFAQYPVVTKMLTPRPTLSKTILNFIAYRHYYYGSPFYFSSALVVLPVKLIKGLGDTQLNMLLVRQVIGVLPMLAALLLITYVQTKFHSYTKSILLFVCLSSVHFRSRGK